MISTALLIRFSCNTHTHTWLHTVLHFHIQHTFSLAKSRNYFSFLIKPFKLFRNKCYRKGPLGSIQNNSTYPSLPCLSYIHSFINLLLDIHNSVSFLLLSIIHGTAYDSCVWRCTHLLYGAKHLRPAGDSRRRLLQGVNMGLDLGQHLSHLGVTAQLVQLL